jgi:hypothetical protein
MPQCKGESINWDITIADTIADSYLAATSITAGAAAEAAAERMTSKNATLMHHHLFETIAVDIFGPMSWLKANLSFGTLANVSPPTLVIRGKQPPCFSGYRLRYSDTMPFVLLAHFSLLSTPVTPTHFFSNL